MIRYSDRGTPKSARFTNGYGSHTVSLWNEKGERSWVKFHFHTRQGIQNLSADEADEIAGKDPDYSSADLSSAIEAADFPEWAVKVQIMPELDADTYRINPLALARVWPHGAYPLIEIGAMALNRNPENDFAEIGQSAFEPSNVVPGIGSSPDKMLQNRNLSYADAHRYRLGANYHQIPVDQARNARVQTYHRDGAMRTDGNHGAQVDCQPNSFGGPVEAPSFAEPPLRIRGDAARYGWPNDDADLYGQPRDLWSMGLDEGARQRLVQNIVTAMGDSPRLIQARMIGHWYKVYPDFGRGVAEGLGIEAGKAAAE